MGSILVMELLKAGSFLDQISQEFKLPKKPC